MKKALIISLCIFILACLLGCGSKKPAAGPPQDDGSAIAEKNSGDNTAIDNFNDLPESIFDEVKKEFKNSGIQLASLQRDKKGEKIKADTDIADAKEYVPRAIEILTVNFSSVNKVIVCVGGGTEYSMTMEKYQELQKKNPDDLYQKLWDEVSGGSQIAGTDAESPAV